MPDETEATDPQPEFQPDFQSKPWPDAQASVHLAPEVPGYLADPRLRCCLEAAVEVAILLGLVLQRIKASDAGVLKLETQVLLVRCLRLCNLMQDGLGDETIATDRMQAVLALEDGR